MYGVSTLHVQLRHTINRFADNVHHTPFYLFASWHSDGATQRSCLKVALQTVGIVHGHAAHGVFADMLLNLYYQFTAVGPNDAQGFVYLWQHFFCFLAFRVEVNINNRTNDLRYVSFYV